jgi:hypothetical protein
MGITGSHEHARVQKPIRQGLKQPLTAAQKHELLLELYPTLQIDDGNGVEDVAQNTTDTIGKESTKETDVVETPVHNCTTVLPSSNEQLVKEFTANQREAMSVLASLVWHSHSPVEAFRDRSSTWEWMCHTVRMDHAFRQGWKTAMIPTWTPQQNGERYNSQSLVMALLSHRECTGLTKETLAWIIRALFFLYLPGNYPYYKWDVNGRFYWQETVLTGTLLTHAVNYPSTVPLANALLDLPAVYGLDINVCGQSEATSTHWKSVPSAVYCAVLNLPDLKLTARLLRLSSARSLNHHILGAASLLERLILIHTPVNDFAIVKILEVCCSETVTRNDGSGMWLPTIDALIDLVTSESECFVKTWLRQRPRTVQRLKNTQERLRTFPPTLTETIAQHSPISIPSLVSIIVDYTLEQRYVPATIIPQLQRSQLPQS